MVDSSIAVQGAELNLSVIGLVAKADIIVQSVMLLLVIASVWCWSIIFDKWRLVRQTRDRAEAFDMMYQASKGIGDAYEHVKKKAESVMAKMLLAGVDELQKSVAKGKLSKDQIEVVQDRVFYAIQRIRNQTVGKLEKQLVILATVGVAAPFLGLLGTVWGIVNSFQAIAVSNNTSLAVVAPGIAEALLATAIGLFAAIPAVVFYNLFSHEIKALASRFDEFNDEISTLLVHHWANVKGDA